MVQVGVNLSYNTIVRQAYNKHFVQWYFILVIKTKTIIMTALVC